MISKVSFIAVSLIIIPYYYTEYVLFCTSAYRALFKCPLGNTVLKRLYLP